MKSVNVDAELSVALRPVGMDFGVVSMEQGGELGTEALKGVRWQRIQRPGAI